jgi:class 3 adenylate cyclase/Flp pilus assembly protein TadD
MTSKGATMDVGGWLRGLGLGQFEATFRESEIDFDVLPELTEPDLEKLGVPLGHRKRLLKAIASLGATAALGPAPAQSPTAQAIAPPTPETAGERRHVTVMFSDLVGSTALSARIDPEDLREVISAYQKCVAETVQRFGGFVAKYMGDGVLVYFGYPQAHEDDAERAVRAGLRLVAAVGDLKTTRAPLQTRVGIATGLVVVGDLVGSGEAQERGIVGDAPNLAARLQGLAEPNSVVIAESTRKLLGNLFELEDLGARDLKGIAGPVRAWAADLYYQGLALFNKGASAENLTQARKFFERALALDPGNLDAWIGTGQVDAVLSATYQTDDRANALASAETTLTKALLQASNNAVAHQYMGLVLVQTKRVSQGIAEYERSLTLDPNLAESRALIGLAKIFDGRAEETERDENEALRLSPRDKSAWAWMHFSGSAKLYLGADEEAIAWFRRAIELRRDFPLTHFWLAAALANLGRLEEAQTEAQVGLSLDPTFTIRRFLDRPESDNPVFLKQREHHADAMRKTGIPEE